MQVDERRRGPKSSLSRQKKQGTNRCGEEGEEPFITCDPRSESYDYTIWRYDDIYICRYYVCAVCRKGEEKYNGCGRKRNKRKKEKKTCYQVRAMPSCLPPLLGRSSVPTGTTIDCRIIAISSFRVSTSRLGYTCSPLIVRVFKWQWYFANFYWCTSSKPTVVHSEVEYIRAATEANTKKMMDRTGPCFCLQ